jgi:hypothetical protein
LLEQPLRDVGPWNEMKLHAILIEIAPCSVASTELDPIPTSVGIHRTHLWGNLDEV